MSQFHPMKNYRFLIFIICIIFGCNEKSVIIFDLTKGDTTILAKNSNTENKPSGFYLDITENNLDDTCYVNNRKIAPNQIGNIYSLKDYYLDTMSVSFKKYKAQKGLIKIKYSF